MNQGNQECNRVASANIPMKRKRGRPRKHPKPSFGHGENSMLKAVQNVYHRENASIPPRFQGMNRTHYPSADPINNTNDVMVGQVVHGVIEAAFDAGYLLNVKVGNSETTLSGVVFKPGQYVPVSANNDVAPHVQMVRRNEIPFPAENYSPVHGHSPRSRERNEQHVNPSRNGTASLVPLKSKQAASMPHQTTHPVIPKNVYWPINLPNGQAAANHRSSVSSQIMDLETSKVKPVLEAAIPSNGLTPTKQVQMDGNQLSPLPAQTNHQEILSQPPAEVLLEAEAKSMKLPGMQFEKLLTEVVKRIQAPSKSVGTKIGDKNDETDEVGQALSVEPPKAVQSNGDNHSASVTKPFENFRTGKMTELLRAVQENIMENQAPRAQEPASDSRLNFDELKRLGAEIGDQENDTDVPAVSV